MTKTVWTLNIGDYEPAITGITYPFLKHWARKIDAEFREITERKFPDWPVVYEKLQLHELGRESEWNIYVDSDALIHPDMFDVTDHLSRDTVCHNGHDMAGNRWKYDQYFRRDSRHIGSCNWFTCASNWCLDLWRPLDDLTLDQATSNIFPTVREHNSQECQGSHLIDDYTLSRNIARFGLKFKTVQEIYKELGVQGGFLWHQYALPGGAKLHGLKKMLVEWGLD